MIRWSHCLRLSPLEELHAVNILHVFSFLFALLRAKLAPSLVAHRAVVTSVLCQAGVVKLEAISTLPTPLRHLVDITHAF